MERDELFETIMVALRSTTTDEGLQTEVNDLILAARADLNIDGLVSDEFASSKAVIIRQAITLYVKAHWGYDNPDSEKFLDRYEKLKTSLSFHSQYGGGTSEV